MDGMLQFSKNENSARAKERNELTWLSSGETTTGRIILLQSSLIPLRFLCDNISNSWYFWHTNVQSIYRYWSMEQCHAVRIQIAAKQTPPWFLSEFSLNSSGVWPQQQNWLFLVVSDIGQRKIMFCNLLSAFLTEKHDFCFLSEFSYNLGSCLRSNFSRASRKNGRADARFGILSALCLNRTQKKNWGF